MSVIDVGGGWSLDWDWHGVGLESESGDLHVVARHDGGVVIAVIDGLGHGPDAAVASRAIASALQEHAGDPIDQLVRRCHERARPTRGGVMSVASFVARDAILTWCGVGNVEALLFRSTETAPSAKETVTSHGGIVGYQLPKLHVENLAIASEDLLVMATDGIESGFEVFVDHRAPPTITVQTVMRQHARSSDDALVVAARFIRDPS